ncbi:hypothetical protein JCM8097_003642 [Rhodosporidiobolus ruineniae]
MDADSLPFTEPIASTSRAVVTLAYKEPEEDNEQPDAFTDPANLVLYDRAWSECNTKIQTTLSSLHDASLDEIVSFVHSTSSAGHSLYSALSGKVPLPTGLIVGASPGSSSLLFSSLIRLLSRPSTSSADTAPPPCLVSRVSSRDCSNIKNALRSVIGGFIGGAANVELDEEDEDEMEVASGPATIKSALLVPEDMLNLKAWYEHRYAKSDAGAAPTLAILIEDLEAMDGKVLTQLIETLSIYTSTLPLVLLIGIATTSTALYSLLSRKTSNLLSTRDSFVDPGVGAFNALVRGVFVDWAEVPLGLGTKAYGEMWRTFEDLHQSIDATVSFIQYLYMSHFTSSPLAALTLPPSSASDSSALTPAVLEALRALPSLSSAPPSADTLTLLSPTSSPSEDVLPALSALREARLEWARERAIAFEALTMAMEFWEKRRPMEVLLLGVLGEEGKAVEKWVDEVGGLILQASSSKLPTFLRTLTSRLSSYLSAHAFPTSSSSSPLLSFLTAQLSTLDPILSAPRPSGRTNLVNSNLAGGLAGFAAAVGGGGGARNGETDADRAFSRVARETSEGWKERVRSALKPCTDLPLHELWFTNDSSAMKRFHPAPLPLLFRTLSKFDPLSSTSRSSPPPPSSAAANPEEGDQVPHDLAVAYRVYAETHASGRLVNLGEWWAGFEIGVGEEPEEGAEAMRGVGKRKASGGGGGRGGKKARRDEDDEAEEDEGEDDDEDEEDEEEDEGGPARRKQARFLRAVGDLAHLGFLHPTTYRPEHVLKSVY